MKIIVFSYGDAQDPQIWSNVPYCATKALEKQGVTIHYVDFSPQRPIGKALIGLFNKISRFINGRDTQLLWQHLSIFRRRCTHTVLKAVEMHPNADLMLFFTFSQSGMHKTHVPSVLFCDFTIDYVIKCILQRKPSAIEKRLIKQQDEVISSSDLMISLFPQATEYYKQRYSTCGIYGIDGHVINSFIDLPPMEETIGNKIGSNSVVFIGRKKYRQAALTLIKSINGYNKKHNKELNVEIIGMTGQELGIGEAANIKCYGVLNKSTEAERNKYYDIVIHAKCIVNTAANWAGISSIVEAMWFYTPVITSEYNDFVKIFGNHLSFGYYCAAEDCEDLENKIECMMAKDEHGYKQMCIDAHNAVSEFTWDNCIGKVINEWKRTVII